MDLIQFFTICLGLLIPDGQTLNIQQKYLYCEVNSRISLYAPEGGQSEYTSKIDSIKYHYLNIQKIDSTDKLITVSISCSTRTQPENVLKNDTCTISLYKDSLCKIEDTASVFNKFADCRLPADDAYFQSHLIYDTILNNNSYKVFYYHFSSRSGFSASTYLKYFKGTGIVYFDRITNTNSRWGGTTYHQTFTLISINDTIVFNKLPVWGDTPSNPASIKYRNGKHNHFNIPMGKEGYFDLSGKKVDNAMINKMNRQQLLIKKFSDGHIAIKSTF